MESKPFDIEQCAYKGNGANNYLDIFRVGIKQNEPPHTWYTSALKIELNVDSFPP